MCNPCTSEFPFAFTFMNMIDLLIQSAQFDLVWQLWIIALICEWIRAQHASILDSKMIMQPFRYVIPYPDHAGLTSLPGTNLCWNCMNSSTQTLALLSDIPNRLWMKMQFEKDMWSSKFFIRWWHLSLCIRICSSTFHQFKHTTLSNMAWWFISNTFAATQTC